MIVTFLSSSTLFLMLTDVQDVWHLSVYVAHCDIFKGIALRNRW